MAEIKDLKLSDDLHDLVFEDYDLSFVSGLDRVKQNMRIRLWTFAEEWFLDTSVGLPWFTEINVKAPNLQAIDALLRREILAVQDVLEIVEFTLDYNAAARTMQVDFKAKTNFGELSVREAI